MRSVLSVIVWLAVILITSAARGQGASAIEPYEVLYGRPLVIQLRLPTQKMLPSEGTLALVQARTDTLLARVASVSAALGPSPSKQSLKDLATTVHQEESEAADLRNRGKHYAAWRKASVDFLIAEYLTGLVEAAAKEVVQDASGGRGSLSKLPEARARLDQFYTRLQLVRPSSVSVALALAEAYSQWVDATSLLDLVQNHPTELLALMEPHWGTVSAEKRDPFVRWVLEPIMVPVLQWIVEDAELLLQASQSDPISVLRPGESELRRLAKAYTVAARANLAVAAGETEGSKLPSRTPKQQAVGRLSYVLITQRLEYARSHQNDVGMSAVLANLGVSAAAYRASLDELAELHILTSPQVAAASAGGDVAAAISHMRTLGMQLEDLHTLDAAAQAQAALGHVPTPVRLAYQRAQELHEGDAEDQELAQTEQINATTLAQLAAGLASPPPRASFPIDDNGPNVGAEPTREDYILACIERLRFSELGAARGFLVNKALQLPEYERDNLIEAALVEACTRARDLRSSVRPYFFEILRNNLAQWYRDVAIFERSAPKLTTTCTGAPDQFEGLLGRQRCTLLQEAMQQLPENDRKLIELKFYEKLSYADLGQRLGIKEDAARQRVNRALNRLRDFFKAQEPDSFSLRLLLRTLWGADRIAWMAASAARHGAKCLDLKDLQEI